MKQLESFIGQLMVSRLFVHMFFCLVFVAAFSLSVIMSGNFDVASAAMMSCIYLLICTYVGRWYGWIYFTIKNSCEPDSRPQAEFAEPSGIGLHHTLKRLNLIDGQQYAYKASKENDHYAVDLRLKADKL